MKINLSKMCKYFFISAVVLSLSSQASSPDPFKHFVTKNVYDAFVSECFKVQGMMSDCMKQDAWIAGLPTTNELYRAICGICNNVRAYESIYAYRKGHKLLNNAKKWITFIQNLNDSSRGQTKLQKIEQLRQQPDKQLSQLVAVQKKIKIKQKFSYIFATIDVIEITSPALAKTITDNPVYACFAAFSYNHKIEDFVKNIQLSQKDYIDARELVHTMNHEIEVLKILNGSDT